MGYKCGSGEGRDMIEGPLSALPRIAWGKGIHLYDEHGRRYIDASGGPAVSCIGHGNEEVNEAIRAQLEKAAYAYRHHFRSEPAEELERVVGDGAGGDLRHVIFTTGGSESVEGCLKLALQYHAARARCPGDALLPGSGRGTATRWERFGL